MTDPKCAWCDHFASEHRKPGARDKKPGPCELPLCCCVAYIGAKPEGEVKVQP